MSVHRFAQLLCFTMLLLLHIASCTTQQGNVCIKTLEDLQHSVFGSPSAGDANHENLLTAFFPPNKLASLIVEVFYHVNVSWVTDNTTMATFPSYPEQFSTSPTNTYRFRWSWSPILLILEPFQVEYHSPSTS